MAADQRDYGDCVFVASKDCSKLHSPAKVHAWFNYAVERWPTVPWIGKMEDDGVLWPSALLTDLDSLPPHAALQPSY
eukprot:4640744-Prymnesium_polylepis.1